MNIETAYNEITYFKSEVYFIKNENNKSETFTALSKYYHNALGQLSVRVGTQPVF